jgi:hypothetical protein
MPIIVGSGGSGTSAAGLSNYAELVASIGAWLDRDDLNDMAPDFIKLLESRLNRILRVPEMEASEELTATDGVATLPTDWLQIRHVYWNGDIDSEIVPVPLSTIRRDYPLGSYTGRPQVYAVVGGAIHLAPLPGSESGDLTLHYYEKIPALTSDDDTNWLLTSHPDIYLWGSLIMAELYGWNDERLPLIKSAWDEAIEELKGQGVSKHHGGGPLFPRPIARPGARS